MNTTNTTSTQITQQLTPHKHCELNKLSVSGGTGGVGGLGNVSAINKARVAYNDAVNAANNYKDITKQLSETYSEFSNVQIKGLTDVIEKQKKIKPVKVSDFFLVDTNIKDIPDKFIDKIAVETGDHIHTQIQSAMDKQPAIVIKPNFDLDKNAIIKKMQDIAEIISGTVADVFIAVGEDIGNLINGKGNFFDGILKVLGDGLVKLGEYVIISSQLISKIKLALTAALAGSGGAGLGIAVGVGLIALGTVLKNIPKFATGGVVTRPTLALIGEQGPERITPLSYSNNSSNNIMQGEVIFQISGQTLRGILKRADQTAYNQF